MDERLQAVLWVMGQSAPAQRHGDVTDATRFDQLENPALERAEFVMAVEQHYRIEVPDSAYASAETIGQLAEIIAKRLPRP